MKNITPHIQKSAGKRRLGKLSLLPSVRKIQIHKVRGLNEDILMLKHVL
jgi:hypothetical protein